MGDEPLCGSCSNDNFGGYAQFFDDALHSELWPLCNECLEFAEDVVHDLMVLGAMAT